MGGGRLAIALAALLLAGPVEARQKAAPAAAGREPELRLIEPKKDAAALKRLEFIRAKLPAEYRKRNNFAWAVAKIDGLDKTEYFAHSGIQDLDSLSSAARKRLAGISLKPDPKHAKFKTLCVDQNDKVGTENGWQRDVDTEYKIIEDLAARLPDTSAPGRMRLFTELAPCASCWGVMKQFLAVYTNVQLQVLYRTP